MPAFHSAFRKMYCRLSAQQQYAAGDGDGASETCQPYADALVAPAVEVEAEEEEQERHQPKQLRGQVEQEARPAASGHPEGMGAEEVERTQKDRKQTDAGQSQQPFREIGHVDRCFKDVEGWDAGAASCSAVRLPEEDFFPATANLRNKSEMIFRAGDARFFQEAVCFSPSISLFLSSFEAL